MLNSRTRFPTGTTFQNLRGIAHFLADCGVVVAAGAAGAAAVAASAAAAIHDQVVTGLSCDLYHRKLGEQRTRAGYLPLLLSCSGPSWRYPLPSIFTLWRRHLRIIGQSSVRSRNRCRSRQRLSVDGLLLRLTRHDLLTSYIL